MLGKISTAIEMRNLRENVRKRAQLLMLHLPRREAKSELEATSLERESRAHRHDRCGRDRMHTGTTGAGAEGHRRGPVI